MTDKEFIYRIKYWRWVNPEFGEWVRTGLIKNKDTAEGLASHLRLSHEQVDVYLDEGEI